MKNIARFIGKMLDAATKASMDIFKIMIVILGSVMLVIIIMINIMQIQNLPNPEIPLWVMIFDLAFLVMWIVSSMLHFSNRFIAENKPSQ